MKRIFLLLILNLLIAGYGRAQKSCLQRRGNATQLIINDTPYLILGGELGNSSAANTQDIERIFPKLQKMGLNTVLVPAYWDLLEPVEGDFDFTLTDKVLEQARKYNLKVVFFGSVHGKIPRVAMRRFGSRKMTRNTLGRIPKAASPLK